MIPNEQMRYRCLSQLEQLGYEGGARHIVGVDEAGRGPVAGPLVAAAVELNPDDPIYGLDDSKKLSPKTRDRLFDQIIKRARQVAVVTIDAQTIDEEGIGVSNKRALFEAVSSLETPPDLVLADYFQLTDTPWPWRGFTQGDARSVSIAAASIVAKVTRDRYMQALDSRYPDYGFAQHKGYGTPKHRAILQERALTPEHRRSFLYKWGLGDEPS